VDSVFDKNRRILAPIMNIGKMFFKGITKVNSILDESKSKNLNLDYDYLDHKQLHDQVEVSFNILPLLDIANGLYYKNKLKYFLSKPHSSLILEEDGQTIEIVRRRQ